MFDPTQTQPLSWRMHQGKAMPWEDVPIDPQDRQAPSIDDSPPDRLSERGYRLLERLGSGRLGAIYRGQDELSRISGSDHFVAIQLVDERIATRPGFDADFERGAAELKSVSHPNIVRLLEYGRDGKRFYLVNELLESASLRFVLNDTGTLPGAETIAVLRSVGDALQYLHAKGIVHGALKPEAVLVTFGYEVKLLDIVPGGWLVNPNDALGVPARAPDKRDDVFGIACLAYEMLSGRHPYNGNTAQEAYRAGLEPERVDGLGDREWRALWNALAVHRDDRTPNVAQFLNDFGAAGIQKLRAVVAAGGEARAERAEPYVPAPAPAAAASPMAPMAPMAPAPVFGERPAREAPERRSVFGQLFLLLLVVAGGFAAWYYQEPLRTFGSDLIGEVETRMASETATTDRAGDAPAPAATAPLERAPAVTDPEPATVLAPGATPPPATATAPQPQIQQPAVAPPPAAPTTQQPPVTAPAPAATQPEQVAPAPAPDPAPVAAAGPASFGFQQDVVTVRESDVAARVTIRRSGNLSGTATVSWWTEPGTARPDADYADLGARIERFAPGEAMKTVFVPLTNDAAAEPAKSFSIYLGRGEGAESVAAEARVDIVDDD
jgi:hypothetical protein